MAEKKLSFEQSIERLQEIVAVLEKGDAPLADSLKLFEEGTRLVSSCTDLLGKAEPESGPAGQKRRRNAAGRAV